MRVIHSQAQNVPSGQALSFDLAALGARGIKVTCTGTTQDTTVLVSESDAAISNDYCTMHCGDPFAEFEHYICVGTRLGTLTLLVAGSGSAAISVQLYDEPPATESGRWAIATEQDVLAPGGSIQVTASRLGRGKTTNVLLHGSGTDGNLEVQIGTQGQFLWGPLILLNVTTAAPTGLTGPGANFHNDAVFTLRNNDLVLPTTMTILITTAI